MSEPDPYATSEERFDVWRRRVGLGLGPAALVALWSLPLPLSAPQQRLAAVFALVIIYWLTEAVPIPVTSLVGLALCVLLGVAPAAQVFGAFASPTIFLFVGSFILARAMHVHGLDRRFAYLVLSLPGIGRTSYGIIVVFGAITATLSAFMSNTATTAMMTPIATGIVGAVATTFPEGASPRRSRFVTALMLVTAYGASIGGLLTPVGSPPNLIGRALLAKETGELIPFFTWVTFAAPIVAVMFVVLCVVLIALNPPEARQLEGVAAFVRTERAKLGPLSGGERNTLFAFGMAVVLWLLPGLTALILGVESPASVLLAARAEEATVALVAAAALFFLPLRWRGEPTLTWHDAQAIDWGTIILFGAGIVFGALMTSTGLATILGAALAHAVGDAGPLVFTALATVVAVVISETTSNTASVAIVVPVVLPLARAAGIDPMLPGLAAVFGASFGFILPVSTPPNAIVYGTGLVPITRMVRSGLVFDALGAVVIVFGLWLMLRAGVPA